MKYSKLIKLLHNKYSSVSYKELKYIIDEIFLLIKKSVKEGKRVEIRGFGIFEPKLYKSKMSFDPRTLKYNKLSDRLVPFYKASTVLKRDINSKDL